MWIVMPTASLKAKYLSQKLLLMKKSEECFIGNCIYPAKLFIKNLFAKGSTKTLFDCGHVMFQSYPPYTIDLLRKCDLDISVRIGRLLPNPFYH